MKRLTLIALSVIALGGCKISSAAPADSAATELGKKTCLSGAQPKGNSCPTTSVAQTPTPTPTPTPTASTVVAASLAGAAAVADNFDVNQWLEPGETPTTSADEVG